MTEDEQKIASLEHAQLLLQAGINSSRLGQQAEALNFFAGAQRRFESFDHRTDAGIARAWADSLRRRLEEQASLSAAAV